jgi:hypothetical protein
MKIKMSPEQKKVFDKLSPKAKEEVLKKLQRSKKEDVRKELNNSQKAAFDKLSPEKQKEVAEKIRGGVIGFKSKKLFELELESRKLEEEYKKKVIEAKKRLNLEAKKKKHEIKKDIDTKIYWLKVYKKELMEAQKYREKKVKEIIKRKAELKKIEDMIKLSDEELVKIVENKQAKTKKTGYLLLNILTLGLPAYFKGLEIKKVEGLE